MIGAEQSRAVEPASGTWDLCWLFYQVKINNYKSCAGPDFPNNYNRTVRGKIIIKFLLRQLQSVVEQMFGAVEPNHLFHLTSNIHHQLGLPGFP